ncbi:MAG: putative oxidoreductase, short-chain dehydrogenase/reductase family [Solirubrobacteraceae bacterium]|nr:putative oxidoreductase, short-chain dehydrogenase/reductase family [Solirubrobacteraceae bacterium]
MSARDYDISNLAGRTVVVTGANSGIGRAAARTMAGAGARVVLAVRDTAKGEEAAASMTGDTEVRRLDLADLSSVRAFAEGWSGPIDVLVNNAGIMAVPEGRTADGFERQIGTNHLGHFALTNLLLPHIADRVVTVSSTAHKIGRIDLEDLNWERRTYHSWPAYGQSKLANLLFTLELQRRLTEADSPVRAFAVHPGYSSTGLQSHTGSRLQDLLMGLANHVVAQSDEQGSEPTVYAATQDLAPNSFVGPDGFQEMRGKPKLVGRTKQALDEDKARGLWELSEELTGVTFPALAATPA